MGRRRSEFRQRATLRLGESDRRQNLNEWKSEADNPVLWLALAATQWRCGRLEDRVKARVIQIIDDGADLERWKEGGDVGQLRKRQGVLRRLRDQLTSTPPAKTKVKPLYKSSCDWETGELIAYELLAGNRVIFRVLGLEGDSGGTWPVCELLDWAGESVPSEAELSKLPIRNHVASCGSKPQLGIGRASRKEYPEKRITRLKIKLRPVQQLAFPRTFVLWRHLDDVLAKEFGLP